MNFDNVLFNLKRPFMNLTKRAKVLQLVRLISGLLGFTFTMVIVTGAFTSSNLYVNRLDCAHVEVANGLFSVLRETVSSGTDSLAENYGAGLTASQIELLSSYTEKNVEQAPQFIQSNIFNWCFGDYNETTSKIINNTVDEETKYVGLYCTKHDRNYVFDYRGELKIIGLNIILAYAYDDTSVTTTASNDNYVPDRAYLEKLKQRRDLSKTISSLSILSAITDVVILGLAILMYRSRGYDKDDSNVPQLYKLVIPIFSLLSSISIFIAIASMTALSILIRNEIKSELGSFGISSHLGSTWFGMAWTDTSLHFFNLCAWGGPVWCGAPSTPIKMSEPDDMDYIGTPSFKQRKFKLGKKTLDEEFTDDFEMQDNFSKSNPFEDPFERSEDSFEGDESWERLNSVNDPAPKTSSKKNLRELLHKDNSLKVRTKLEKQSSKGRRLTGLDEDEYVASDMFLTEDDRFILKRENLLLDPQRRGSNN